MARLTDVVIPPRGHPREPEPADLELLTRRLATARAQLAERAGELDRAKGKHADAQREVHGIEEAMTAELNRRVAAVSRGYSTRDLAAGVLDGSHIAARNIEADVLPGGTPHRTVDLADSFEAERSDTGGGACS